MDTADAMYETGRYLYVVFMAQQGVEKAIKALIEAKGKVAPFEHNLRKLLIVAESEKEVPAEWWERVDFLS
jgi:HEPN domain-containing protein